MNDQPIDFYLNQHCIEIVDKLENISHKLHKIASEFKKAEIILEEDRKTEMFQKIKIDARIRK
jgi:hypothetical protein